MPSNAVLSVRLKHPKGQYVSVEFALEVFSPDSVGANDDVIVVGETGVFAVLGDNFHVEARTVLDRECFVV